MTNKHKNELIRYLNATNSQVTRSLKDRLSIDYQLKKSIKNQTAVF
jgi:hypothetical protein